MKKKLKVKNNRKISIYTFLLDFLSISLIGLIVIFALREYNTYLTANTAMDALTAFEALGEIEGIEETYEKETVKIGKYKIIGSIKIDSIGLNYPILETTTQESLRLSITKLTGPDLNQIGNVSIAGHNFRNGTLFGKISSINIGDTIEITDSKNTSISYEVTEIYSVKPDNLNPLKQNNDGNREITLVSCIMGGKKRIIVKAIEKV